MIKEKALIIIPQYIKSLHLRNKLKCNELRFIVERFLEQNPEYTPILSLKCLDKPPPGGQ